LVPLPEASTPIRVVIKPSPPSATEPDSRYLSVRS
jgi:hypothetical protein